MRVENTNTGFTLSELTQSEMELIQMGLVHIKQQSLRDPEVFKRERESCDEMFLRIDLELISSKTPQKAEPCVQH